MACWLASVLDPFDRPACHIPDENVAESGAVKGFLRDDYSPSALSGTSTTHIGGYIMFPHNEAGFVQLFETSAGSNRLATQQSTVPPLSRKVIPNCINYGKEESTARVTSMGIRSTYTGTELQMAGKYYAGLLPIVSRATVNSSGYYEPLSVFDLPNSTTAGFDLAVSLDVIKNRLVHASEGRISSSTFHMHWKPSLTPIYQKTQLNSGVPVSGASLSESIYSASMGGRGCQLSQYALVFLIVGDSTTTASAGGNTYSLLMAQHTEVMPDDVSSVTFPVESSPYDVRAMQSCINTLGVSKIAANIGSVTEMSNATKHPTFVNSNDLSSAARGVISELTGEALPFLKTGAKMAIRSGVDHYFPGWGNAIPLPF